MPTILFIVNTQSINIIDIVPATHEMPFDPLLSHNYILYTLGNKIIVWKEMPFEY